MTTFAEAFRDIVAPDLLAAARLQALAVAAGRHSFSDAHEAVFRLARQRGALFLPINLIMDLDGWIGTQILEAIAEFEQSPDARREFVHAVTEGIFG